jgi:cytochrome P450
MDAVGAKPVRLTGPTALAWGFEFARDPPLATRRLFEANGPYVILAEALPFTQRARATMLGLPLVLTAGAAFNAEVFADAATWRGLSVLPGGPKNSAAWRMSFGLPRLTGERHAYYRKLISPPLRRGSVEALTAEMAQLTEAEVSSWPLGGTIDLWDGVRRIMQGISVALLFGEISEQSRAIAALSGEMMERKWQFGALALPINLPMTPYGKIVRDAEELERRILQWVAAKRGHRNERDLASIIVNSLDADGNPPDNAAILAHVASLFALSSEGSQSVLVWTLVLLAQHPNIEAALRDELDNKLGGGSPALDRVGELPYLDAVVKESMRVLPPVPLQIRVAQRDTAVAGHPLPERTRIVLNTYLTNRAPDLYPDGDVFRPERWPHISPDSFEYPVFGAGPNMCPGFWFGTAAVKIALAVILTRFRLELPQGTRLDYRTQPTLRPRRRLAVTLRRADDVAPKAMPISGKIRDLVKFPQ